MPDLSEQLSAILQNPEAQQNIKNLLASLGANDPPPQNTPPFDLSSLFSGNSSPPKEENPFDSIGMDMGTLMKLGQIFSKMNCDDQNVNLLRALKPHLKDCQKVDSAINILKIMSILPALKECGIFGGELH